MSDDSFSSMGALGIFRYFPLTPIDLIRLECPSIADFPSLTLLSMSFSRLSPVKNAHCIRGVEPPCIPFQDYAKYALMARRASYLVPIVHEFIALWYDFSADLHFANRYLDADSHNASMICCDSQLKG